MKTPKKTQKKTRRPKTPRLINMDALLERARTRNTPQAPVVGRFVVLQSQSCGISLSEVPGSCHIVGTFPTSDAAHKAIVENTKEDFEGVDPELGRNEGFAGPYFICQVIAARKVIPDVHVVYHSEPALPPTK